MWALIFRCISQGAGRRTLSRFAAGMLRASRGGSGRSGELRMRGRRACPCPLIRFDWILAHSIRLTPAGFPPALAPVGPELIPAVAPRDEPHFSSSGEWAQALLGPPGASDLALSQALPPHRGPPGPVTQTPAVPALGGSNFIRQPRQGKKQRREGDQKWDGGSRRQRGSPEEAPEQGWAVGEVGAESRRVRKLRPCEQE